MKNCVKEYKGKKVPEAPQEWNGEGLPPVGVACEVLDTCYAHPVHTKVKVKGFYKKQVWLTLLSGEDRVVLIANCKFRPLKTQQEKDREAFIDSVNGVFSDGEFDRHDLVLIGAKLFEEGFTAPKDAI